MSCDATCECSANPVGNLGGEVRQISFQEDFAVSALGLVDGWRTGNATELTQRFPVRSGPGEFLLVCWQENPMLGHFVLAEGSVRMAWDILGSEDIHYVFLVFRKKSQLLGWRRYENRCSVPEGLWDRVTAEEHQNQYLCD